MAHNARNGVALRCVVFLLSCVVHPVADLAFANVAPGDLLENPELRTLDGGRHALLSRDALANVFIFFRPGQDHSTETLKQMAACEKEFAGKSVHWVAIVSSSRSPADIKKSVAESGIEMPVLIDEGDALYGRLGVRLHPVVGITDHELRLVAYEPFQKINYRDRIRARIRYALHEIDAAAVSRSENPERALEPNEVKGAVSKRHLRMGEGYLRVQNFEKAELEAHRAIELDAESAPAYVLLGDALAGEGKCDDAAAAYRAAVRLEPGNAAAIEAKAATCSAKR